MSLPRFLEVNELEVEEEISTMVTLSWGGRCVDGQMEEEQEKAWRNQIFDVQRWKRLRGPADAVMCETRDLGNQWPLWCSLLFEEQVAADMRLVCLQDVKKMLSQDGLLEELGSQTRV